ncbi:MAG: hypothetical protein BGO77_04960 [Caedibacter sp. 37-49]|nr:MAG: hypothetical protein BGO77_04960 [Caedibacter sp. 37-49]
MKAKVQSTKITLFSRIILSASLGNTLEFYDFATYGFMMPILAPLFFPSSSPLNSLFLAFGAFAVSFLARPLGGIIFGYIGDKYSRKFSFSLSLILMAISTSLIGLLPTFDQVGILAPLLLTFCRIFQGLCMGGEFSGSLIFATENLKGKATKSAFITGSITAAGVVGWFLSSTVCSLSLKFDQAYAWRIPFLLGALVGVVGYYLRRTTILEAPHYPKNINNEIKMKNVAWRNIFSVMGIGALMGGLFYGLQIFPNSFLPTYFSSISQAKALSYTSFGIAVYMLSLPIMGYLADKVNHTQWMFIFSFLTIVLGYPIFILLMSGNSSLIILAELISSLLLAGFMAPATFIMTQSFPPHLRYRLVSFSYNLGASIFGGLTPGIFLFLIEKFDSLHAPAFYLILCGVFGLFSSYYLSHNKQHLFRFFLANLNRNSKK